MSESKKSFILHLDSLDVLDELTDEQAGQLLKAMRDYNQGKEVQLSGLLKAIFIPFKNQFDRDFEKYQAIVLRNRENGAKGGKPKQTQANPVGNLGAQTNPNKPDNDNDNDSKNDSEIENENMNDRESIIGLDLVRETKFEKPTVSEISIYVLEKYTEGSPEGALKFAEVFWSHYENNGWKVGKNKMKNWKLAIVQWSETLQKNLFPNLVQQKNTIPFGTAQKPAYNPMTEMQKIEEYYSKQQSNGGN